MKKTLLIHGSPDYNLKMLQTVEQLIAHLWWVRMSHDYHVVVADDYGVDSEVMRQCESKSFAVPYTAVGIGVRAKNGARKYERFLPPVGATSRREKLVARDRYLVARADVVLVLAQGGKARDTLDLYEYAKRFPMKQVHMRVFESPLIYV